MGRNSFIYKARVKIGKDLVPTNVTFNSWESALQEAFNDIRSGNSPISIINSRKGSVTDYYAIQRLYNARNKVITNKDLLDTTMVLKLFITGHNH